MALVLFNTLTRKKENFESIEPNKVRMYSCGPTVYDYAHIGNLRAYIFTDILRRTLKYLDFEIKQVMNITDIGHLSSDRDEGEDKMTKALRRENKEFDLKNMREIAEFYTNKFKEDLKSLNIEIPDEMFFASDFILEDIKLIQRLEKKDFVYKTNDGLYFDTSKMFDYGVLWGGKRVHSEEDARIMKNSEKKNSEDFALWKFNDKIGFASPWGTGFPGWHIECSAMSMHELGEQFDIHTGGIEHIPIHHTNEIAQSECATGKKPFVRFWLHNEWVLLGNKKMAKSEGGFLKLNDLKEKNINPLAYRLFCLMANYGSKINFNWEALEGADNALGRLYGFYIDLGDAVGNIIVEYQNKFKEYISNDLDTPKAVSLVWELLKDTSLSDADKKATLLDFDKVLGFNLDKIIKEKIPDEILKIADEREQARKNRDFKKSDDLRKKINSLGYGIKDTDSGPKISKI